LQEEVEAQVREGTVSEEGIRDILGIALGRERPGRVRTVPGVTPSQFWHLPRAEPRRYSSEIEQLKADVARISQHLSAGQV
jgi:hypothetical protein